MEDTAETQGEGTWVPTSPPAGAPAPQDHPAWLLHEQKSKHFVCKAVNIEGDVCYSSKSPLADTDCVAELFVQRCSKMVLNQRDVP